MKGSKFIEKDAFTELDEFEPVAPLYFNEAWTIGVIVLSILIMGAQL